MNSELRLLDCSARRWGVARRVLRSSAWIGIGAGLAFAFVLAPSAGTGRAAGADGSPQPVSAAVLSRLAKMKDRGVRWLQSKREADGTWREPGLGGRRLGVTALVAAALCPVGPIDPRLVAVRRMLLADGGAAGVYDCSVVVAFFLGGLGVATGGADAERLKGLSALELGEVRRLGEKLSHMQVRAEESANGGFAYFESQTRADVVSTWFASLAQNSLRSVTSVGSESALRCHRWLSRQQIMSGDRVLGFSYVERGPAIRSVTCAAVDAIGLSADLVGVDVRLSGEERALWLKGVQVMRSWGRVEDVGGFGSNENDYFLLYWYLRVASRDGAADLRSGSTWNGVIDFLERSQRKDGGWGGGHEVVNTSLALLIIALREGYEAERVRAPVVTTK